LEYLLGRNNDEDEVAVVEVEEIKIRYETKFSSNWITLHTR
jgi:hypothetical protein